MRAHRRRTKAHEDASCHAWHDRSCVYSVLRSPDESDVWLVFFVAAPIGPFDRDEAMPFIKPLGWPVDLECPQRQPLWAALLRQFDEAVADAAASPPWSTIIPTTESSTVATQVSWVGRIVSRNQARTC